MLVTKLWSGCGEASNLSVPALMRPWPSNDNEAWSGAESSCGTGQAIKVLRTVAINRGYVCSSWLGASPGLRFEKSDRADGRSDVLHFTATEKSWVLPHPSIPWETLTQ